MNAAASARPGWHRIVACGAWLVLVAGVVAGGCAGPKFPSCDNDEQCNGEGHKGVCVNHKCAECRDDATCGAGRTCRGGACLPIDGYCDETHACPPGSGCGPDKRCYSTPMAREPVECDETKACASGQQCQNGHCVAPPRGGPGCTDFPAPKFAFESADLGGDSRQTLERLAKCISSGSLKGAKVLLTGHCDARGEEEFNMGLGAQRAEVIRAFVIGLGVPADSVRTSSRGKLDASGTDESGWANDRRVDIEVR